MEKLSLMKPVLGAKKVETTEIKHVYSIAHAVVIVDESAHLKSVS